MHGSVEKNKVVLVWGNKQYLPTSRNISTPKENIGVYLTKGKGGVHFNEIINKLIFLKRHCNIGVASENCSHLYCTTLLYSIEKDRNMILNKCCCSVSKCSEAMTL